jgi:hypothetical protein
MREVGVETAPYHPTGKEPMHTRLRNGFLIIMAAGLLTAGCSSDSSGDITIDVALNDDFTGGTFTATGSAICDSGETLSGDWDVNETVWWYEDQFTCADGSGTFVVKGELPPPPDEPTALDGTWTIVAGDGDYSNLEGSGTLKTEPPETGTVAYVGEMNTG